MTGVSVGQVKKSESQRKRDAKHEELMRKARRRESLALRQVRADGLSGAQLAQTHHGLLKTLETFDWRQGRILRAAEEDLKYLTAEMISTRKRRRSPGTPNKPNFEERAMHFYESLLDDDFHPNN